MVRQEEPAEEKFHFVYIARDGSDSRPKIVDKYKTSSIDEVVIGVLINQAQRKLQTLHNEHYLATNNPVIAEKYNLKLIK